MYKIYMRACARTHTSRLCLKIRSLFFPSGHSTLNQRWNNVDNVVSTLSQPLMPAGFSQNDDIIAHKENLCKIIFLRHGDYFKRKIKRSWGEQILSCKSCFIICNGKCHNLGDFSFLEIVYSIRTCVIWAMDAAPMIDIGISFLFLLFFVQGIAGRESYILLWHLSVYLSYIHSCTNLERSERGM